MKEGTGICQTDSESIWLKAMNKHLWGIDLGGTKIEGVVLPDAATAEPLCRLRIPTEADRGYDHLLDRIVDLVGRMKEATGKEPESIGFGTPGVLDPSLLTLKNSNTACLVGKPLSTDLEERLRLKVRLANDANCFTLAEAKWGAGRGAPTVFGIILGTGVGGGIVVEGKPLTGLQGIAGEWGHNLLEPEGADCYCGRRGCVETVISGPALERHHLARTGKKRTLPEIARAARSDPDARSTLERLVSRFGEALAPVINILDPHVVVVGGGVSNLDLLYTEGPAEVEKRTFNHTLLTPIVRNELGDSAGVFGAALLA